MITAPVWRHPVGGCALLLAMWVSGCSGPDPPQRSSASPPPVGTAPGTAAAPPAPAEANASSAPAACTGQGPLIRSARWIDLDGAPSLEVLPEARLRECEVAGDQAPGWRQVLDRQPAADVPGMREQYSCHARFAPDKEVWHLEPWRPEVPDIDMVRSLCNPGGADPDLLP